MRRRVLDKRDANEIQIVDALRRLGCAVHRLSTHRNDEKGLPDLLVHWMGRTILAEVKDPLRDPSRSKECKANRRLDKDQVDFFLAWQGAELYVWASVEDAIHSVSSRIK